MPPPLALASDLKERVTTMSIEFNSVHDVPNNGTHEPDNMPEAVDSESTIPMDEARNGNLWHSEAGRKGAHRVHQLIREGRLYEQEHGLKRGRQRLRQLMEMGKLYEQEHSLVPEEETKGRVRLSRMEREELLKTLLQCLVRLSKPSFRDDFERVLSVLASKTGDAA
ncbi:MAG: hypothetical protein ACJ8C4_02810 [Gemmataceae bacterium]